MKASYKYSAQKILKNICIILCQKVKHDIAIILKWKLNKTGNYKDLLR